MSRCAIASHTQRYNSFQKKCILLDKPADLPVCLPDLYKQSYNTPHAGFRAIRIKVRFGGIDRNVGWYKHLAYVATECVFVNIELVCVCDQVCVFA